MMIDYTKRITLFLLAICAIQTTASAQWSKANGIGGNVSSIAAKGNTLFAGTDTGGVFISTNFGLNWTASNTGLTNKNVKTLLAKDSVIVAGVDGFGGAIFVSRNNGTSWAEPTTQYFGFLYCFVEHGNDLLAGTWYGIAKSTDNGDKWNTITATGLPSNASVAAMLVNNTHIFAGVTSSSTGGEGIYVSTNGGANWTAKNTGLTNTNITAIAKTGTKIFVATDGGGIFVSSNNGDNWTTANTGLTSLDVNALFIKGNAILAGTDEGIFLSRNDGGSWADVSGGLNAGTKVKTITTSGHNLLLGTDSAVWHRRTADIVTGIEPYPLHNALVQVYPNPTSGNFTIEVPSETKNAEISVLNTLGKVVYETKHSNGIYLPVDISHEAKGIYFVQVKTDAETIHQRIIVQ